jgi:signal transduction histidine kinase
MRYHQCRLVLPSLKPIRCRGYPYRGAAGRGFRQVVKGDRIRLNQCIVHLISNAVKYNRQGGIVGIDVLEITDRDIRIVVRDTGIGIPPDKLEELFQALVRLSAESSNIQGGSIGFESEMYTGTRP